MKRLALAAVSIFLAGIVTVADNRQFCESLDPMACLVLETIKTLAV
jgi:hypothetical protein